MGRRGKKAPGGMRYRRGLSLPLSSPAWGSNIGNSTDGAPVCQTSFSRDRGSSPCFHDSGDGGQKPGAACWPLSLPVVPVGPVGRGGTGGRRLAGPGQGVPDQVHRKLLVTEAGRLQPAGQARRRAEV